MYESKSIKDLLKEMEEEIESRIARDRNAFLDKLLEQHLFISMQFDFIPPKDQEDTRVSDEMREDYKKNPFSFISFNYLEYDEKRGGFTHDTYEESFFLENWLIEKLEKSILEHEMNPDTMIRGVLNYLLEVTDKVSKHFNYINEDGQWIPKKKDKSNV